MVRRIVMWFMGMVILIQCCQFLQIIREIQESQRILQQTSQYKYNILIDTLYKIQHLKMRRNSPFESHHQSIPTIQSIQAQSQISVDLRPNELQPLISKIFMLCLELQRKDTIIERLQTQAHLQDQTRRSQIDLASRDLHLRYDRLEQENRVLIQSNVMLKNTVATLERTVADLEMHRKRAMYNQELEEKVYGLELRLKKAEEEKIQYVERQKSLKRENSMLSFSAIKTSEKNRIRDLEHQLAQEKAKLDAEKRMTSDLRYEVDKINAEVKTMKESEYVIRKTFEEKIQKIQIQKTGEDIRRSQFTAANEEKIVLLSQELNRLREQLDYQKDILRQEKAKFEQKQSQIRVIIEQKRILEVRMKEEQEGYQKMLDEARRKQEAQHSKQQQLIKQSQNSQHELKILKQTRFELEGYLKQKKNQENEKNREIERLRNELQHHQTQKSQILAQLRKLKRKTISTSSQCQVCKIRSISVIPSSKSINGRPTMNLEEIIEETERLHLSNKKIENLINHHEISTHYSQHSIVNTSQ